MQIKSVIQQLSEEPNVFIAQMTRSEVRDLVDEVEHEGLMTMADEAQGAADATGKTAYLIIEITGARL